MSLEINEKMAEIRDELRKEKDIDRRLTQMSVEVYQGVDYHPFVKAYVLKGEAFGISEGHYLYLVFNKRPGHRALVVSDALYSTAEEAVRNALSALRYFPLYGFSHRFLLD
jgi:hypothetical protein